MSYIERFLEKSASQPSPAYMLHGPPRSEKRRLAEKFAATLLHHENTKTHQDFIVLTAEEGKKQISVDQVRAMMRERLFLRPIQAPRLVAYLPHADQLNESGMNCLLKVLEEPPADAVFILVTEDLHRLPATVVSRCVVLRCDVPRHVNSPHAERGEEFALAVIRARTLGARLAHIERFAKECDASDDPQAAWRDALLDAMRFPCVTNARIVFGVALLTALRFVGGPLSPRIALEAAATRLGSSDLDTEARFLMPSHAPRIIPLLFGDLVY